QLPAVVGALDTDTVLSGGILSVALLTSAVVIAARFVWVFPSIYFRSFLGRRFRQEGPGPRWQVAFVVSWAGMRGVVSLAAAFGLPLTLDDGGPLPGREAALFITFVVVIVTLVVQGFTLPTVIRRLGVVGQESAADTLAEAGASQAAADAANKRLEELLAESETQVPADVVTRLRKRVDLRALLAWERLGPTGPERRETPQEAYRRLRREMLAVERIVFVDLRDSGDIDDEVLRRVMTELDLEEALISR
ncbi:MAG: cation:proton antiporter, partial [Geodermatophilaceae bacterium]|nr:cation:proton antiporter [Geodermatophilaceae bacterium]